MFSGDEDDQDDIENEQMTHSDQAEDDQNNENMSIDSSSSSSDVAQTSEGVMDEDDDDDDDDDENEEDEDENGDGDGEDDRPNTTDERMRSRSSSINKSQPLNNVEDSSIPPPTSAQDHSTRLDFSPQTPSSYASRIALRKKQVTAPRLFSKPPLIDPLVFIPHGAPIHALALPPCGSHLFSGGQDGFIRRISIYDSVTGSTTENLTMKQGGHIPQIEKEGDKTTIFLTGYWENEDDVCAVQNFIKPSIDPSGQPAARSNHRWGPKSVGNAVKVSPVYSLAVHSEELWGLSGTESGNINLFTVRHDEGQIRHVFKNAELPSGPLTYSSDIRGHKPGSVISSLDLNHEQNMAFSGGWDGIVLGWDLNTGQVVNKFVAHASQISTVTMRPDTALSIYDSKIEETLMRSPEVEEPVHPSEQPNEPAMGKPVEQQPSTPEKNPVVISQTTPPSSPDKPLADVNGDEDSEDGSLFGGADNSGSDGDGSPDNSSLFGTPLDELISKPIDPPGGIHDRFELSLPGSKPKLQLPTAAPKPVVNIVPALPPKAVLPPTHLTYVPSVLDSSLPFLNEDILMTSGIDGQVYLWDRRIETSDGQGLVRKLDLPKGTSPWTASVTWSIDGRSVYVGRRNHSVDVYDLRYVRTGQSKSVQRTIRLPSSSGPVSCVKSWPDGRGLLCASFDNVRLWNLQAESDGIKVPFKIIPGNSSGVVSQMCVTSSQRYFITASGDRGWENQSNEYVVIHEIRSI